jgi:hypothetical protein
VGFGSCLQTVKVRVEDEIREQVQGEEEVSLGVY